MATPQGDALTGLHTQKQSQIALVLAGAMTRLWPIIRDDPSDRNVERWLAQVIQAIRFQRLRSATLAQQYIGAYRVMELGTQVERFFPEIKGAINEEQVITSLMVTGPVRLRKEIAAAQKGTISVENMQKLEIPSQGAAIRHTLDGARDTIDNAVENDKLVRGFVRITDGDPCFFCAMLASRGPVYSEDSFAESDPRFQGPGDQKVHDSCQCMIRTVYRGDEPFPGRAKEFDALWREASRVNRGDTLGEFRRMYEKRRRESATVV
jgi:hypothetical protein